LPPAHRRDRLLDDQRWRAPSHAGVVITMTDDTPKEATVEVEIEALSHGTTSFTLVPGEKRTIETDKYTVSVRALPTDEQSDTSGETEGNANQ